LFPNFNLANAHFIVMTTNRTIMHFTITSNLFGHSLVPTCASKLLIN
jgi:hypothetical protein